MNTRIFHEFCKLVYEKSGITLNDGKESLVSARLGKRMRAIGIDDPKEYLQMIKNDATGEELVQMLDSISTNVTSFFRENDHFVFMREMLEKWHKEGQQRFRFWSAACSSGEEPYTMAMVMNDVLGANANAKILATDISTRILEKSMDGLYDAEKVEQIPLDLRKRYFTRSGERDAYQYTVNDEIKQKIAFRRINLSAPPFPIKGPLDIVFCRNVMIYFDNIVRTKLVNEIYRTLKPGGYLFVGHAESLTGLDTEFRTVKPAIYLKKK